MVVQTNGESREHSRTFQDLLQTLEEISGTTFADDGERTEALMATYTLVSQLETPWETILRLCMGQVHVQSLHPEAGAKRATAGIRGCS